MIDLKLSGGEPRVVYTLVDTSSGISVDLASYMSTEDLERACESDAPELASRYSHALDDARLYLEVEGILGAEGYPYVERNYLGEERPGKAGPYERVGAHDFYREIFPEGSFERRGHQEDGRPNGIAMTIGLDGRARQLIVNDGLETIDELQGDHFAFMTPAGYVGRSRKADNMRKIHALTFDLDGVDAGKVRGLIYMIDGSRIFPRPTYVVHSGRGLHLYYVFERPLDAYPNVRGALSELKGALMPIVWNEATSGEINQQRQGIAQGFRIVGTASKMGREYPVTAFRTGGRVTAEYLAEWAPSKDRARILAGLSPAGRPSGKSGRTLAEAKELWPEWYGRRIEGTGGRQTWHVKRDLYDWWLRKVRDRANVFVGNRYFCVMALAVYARKCDVPLEELTETAMGLVPWLDSIKRGADEAFTADDVVRALDAYDDDYVTFPRRSIEEITRVEMPASKRNGRRQNLHLKLARSNLSILSEEAGHALQGRPPGSGTKRDLVRAYAEAHPGENHSQIARALGVSRPTVIKWLKEENG